MEIDFAGDNLKWIEPNCDVQRARLFIAVLPYSNLTYAEVFPNEKQQSWISGIVHALEYFGGTPQVLVMDNAKGLVKHTSWYEGEVQQTVRSLYNYYDLEPWACQPRRHKQKNRIEAGVGLAQRRIIAAMELERTPMARDLDHLNEQGKAKLLTTRRLLPQEGLTPEGKCLRMKNASTLAVCRSKLSVRWISASLSLIMVIAFASQETAIATARRRSTSASAFP